MDVATVTAAYEQLKIAQKKLNAFFESRPDAQARLQITDVLGNVMRAQDILIGLRETLWKQEFENRFLREKVDQYAHEREHEPAHERALEPAHGRESAPGDAAVA